MHILRPKSTPQPIGVVKYALSDITSENVNIIIAIPNELLTSFFSIQKKGKEWKIKGTYLNLILRSIQRFAPSRDEPKSLILQEEFMSDWNQS